MKKQTTYSPHEAADLFRSGAVVGKTVKIYYSSDMENPLILSNIELRSVHNRRYSLYNRRRYDTYVYNYKNYKEDKTGSSSLSIEAFVAHLTTSLYGVNSIMVEEDRQTPEWEV